MDHETNQVEQQHRVRDAGRTLRGLVAGLLLAALIALVLDNRHEVRVGWVFGEGDVALAIVVVGAAIVGVILGWVVSHRPRRRQR